MIAGAAQADITPAGSVWMEGMIRTHKSEGVHDPLYARALFVAQDQSPANAWAIVSLDICMIREQDAFAIARAVEARTGVPDSHVIVAATHTHSGPAALGLFNAPETEYVRALTEKAADAVAQAAEGARAAAAGCASGRENTISHYRRFVSPEGKVVMIWEEEPSQRGLRVLGEPDPEVGVLKVVEAADPTRALCVLFNHAGHPDVMSGDNYAISADYAGVAQRRVEQHFGCTAMFVNGAQGTVDIDNWRYRDWEGMEHLGSVLAEEVIRAAQGAAPAAATVRGATADYRLPRRRITDAELRWAQDVLQRTGGKVQALADGVGDDYKAVLYQRIHEGRGQDIEVRQTCIALGDCAFISFPGEMFTEIGMRIKARSPFRHTYVIGLAGGYIGYLPTRAAIAQGGYEVETRHVDETAEETVVQQSLALLRQVHALD